MDDIAIGIVIGMVFISLIMAFCVVLIRLYFTKIKNYTRVIYQKDIDFQKVLNTTIVETQEQVLHNISQDLHDDAGQQLTYINFQLENLKLDSPEWHETLEPLSESVHNLSQSIRSISHSLNSQLLLQQDLLKAMASEIERLQKNSRILVTFSIKDKNRKDFTTNEKIVIYRVFQEILNNTFKHAKATAVEIAISTHPLFCMKITDNGQGFDLQDKHEKVSIGLKNMTQRAAIIGYGIDIQSAPGKGTSITLTENKTA